jgi:hypothetical protein
MESSWAPSDNRVNTRPVVAITITTASRPSDRRTMARYIARSAAKCERFSGGAAHAAVASAAIAGVLAVATTAAPSDGISVGYSRPVRGSISVVASL